MLSCTQDHATIVLSGNVVHFDNCHRAPRGSCILQYSQSGAGSPKSSCLRAQRNPPDQESHWLSPITSGSRVPAEYTWVIDRSLSPHQFNRVCKTLARQAPRDPSAHGSVAMFTSILFLGRAVAVESRVRPLSLQCTHTRSRSDEPTGMLAATVPLSTREDGP